MIGKDAMLFQAGDDQLAVFECPILCQLVKLGHDTMIHQFGLGEVDAHDRVLTHCGNLFAQFVAEHGHGTGVDWFDTST